MIFSLPDDYKRGVADFLSYFDRDADMFDLMKSVKYELGVYEDYYDDDTAGGVYDYKNGLILISKDIKSGYNMWSTFAHEFGHLLHWEMLDENFEVQYHEQNIPLSKSLECEHIASLIGYEILDWKFPNMKVKNRSDNVYFRKEGILFLKNWDKDYFEDDIGDNYEILLGDRQWNFWNNSFG